MKQLCMLLTYLCLHLTVQAQDFVPSRTVETVDDGVIVTYRFSGGIQQADPSYEGAKSWIIPGFGVNDVAGEPATPFRWDSFAVPDGSTTSLELLDSSFVDTSFVLAPACPPIADDGTPIEEGCINPYTGFFPSKVVQEEGIQHFRGAGVQRVIIQPASYNYITHTLRYFTMIKYKLSFINEPTHTKKTHHSINTPTAANVFSKNVLINNSLDCTSNRQTPPASILISDNKYLILTVDNYLESVNQFAKWKRTKGKNVIISSRSRGAWTVDEVKQTVLNFNDSTGGLQYLLIVGDYSDVPGQQFAYRNNGKIYRGVTDLYYGITDSDSLPDVFRGRISISNNSDAEVVFDKIIQYEKYPVQDTLFYKNGLNCAYFEDKNDSVHHEAKDGYENSCFTLTSELVRNHLISKNKNIFRTYYTEDSISPTNWNDGKYSTGDTIPQELLRTNFAWNGDRDSIKSHINNGVFYVLYRGHGSKSRWGHPTLSGMDLNNLTNGYKLPVVFSLTCLTGKYNDGICFAESFLKKNGGGCVGIFAASETSLSGYSDALSLGMFDAIWPGLDTQNKIRFYDSFQPLSESLSELGAVLDQGLYRMGETYGRFFQGARMYTYKLFHCFGDPSMRIFTEVPQNIAKPHLSVSNNTISVQTQDGDATITFYNGSVISPSVISYYGSEASYNVDSDSVTICIDRPNYRPYIIIYRNTEFIQNETISDTRNYFSSDVKLGNNVTTTKPQGDVNITNANLNIFGGTVELQSGVNITNSNVEINSQ